MKKKKKTEEGTWRRVVSNLLNNNNNNKKPSQIDYKITKGPASPTVGTNKVFQIFSWTSLSYKKQDVLNNGELLYNIYKSYIYCDQL